MASAHWNFSIDLAVNLGASVLFLISGVVIQIMAGRFLAPASYGDFGAILTLVLVLNVVVSSGLGLVVSREVARTGPEGARHVVSRGLRWGLTGAAAVGGLLVVSQGAVRGIFQVTGSSVEFVIAGAMLPVYAASAVYIGALNGLGRARQTGWSLIGAHVSKLLLAGIALFSSAGAVGLLLAYGIANTMPIGLAILNLRALPPATGPVPKADLRFALWTSVFAIAINVAVGVDVFVAKALLDPDVAGRYIAASTLAKIPVTIAAGVTLVVFPLLARRSQNARGAISHLSILLTMTGILVAGVIGVVLVGPLLLEYGYGPLYSAAAPWTHQLAIAFGILGLSSVLAHATAASGRSARAAMVVVPGAVLLGAILTWRGSADGVNGLIDGLFIGSCVLAGATFVMWLVRDGASRSMPVALVPPGSL